MSKKSFVLRIPDDERARAKKLAEKLWVSENRLYAELIHDGLLMREQMLYMSHLREIAVSMSREATLDILSRVPNVPPSPDDAFVQTTK